MRLRSQNNNSSFGSWLNAARRTAKYHAADRLGLRVKPLKLRLALTDRCNAKCIMCNIWKQVDNTAPSLPEEMTVEEMEKMLTLNRAFFSDLRHVAITGGEPTLRRDLVDIFRIFTTHLPQVTMSVNSNGFSSAKTVGAIEEVMQFRKKLSVMISIDGIGEGHDTVRGVKNVYKHCEATIDGLIELRKQHKGLKIEINHCMTSENFEECEKVFEFCKERNLHFNPIYVINGQLYHNAEMNLDLGANARGHLMKVIELMRAKDSSLQLREIIEQLQGKERDFDCWAGRTQFFIEENCDVFPNGGCPSWFKMGNLRDHDFDFARLLSAAQARKVLGEARECRMCRLSCETMTTLTFPEALEGWRRSQEPLPEAADIRRKELEIAG
ncbi:radical SAM protein [Candidatus Sumerlaeota bacterium]|nr:radical SAM protein [Candidatus Sumerlaeota bacterium]